MTYLIKSIIEEYFNPPVADNIIFHPFLSGIKILICLIMFVQFNKFIEADYDQI